MKLILKQDVDDLGLEGDLVDVAKGYGRNFLIPRGLGALATPQNMKAFELQRKKIEVRRLKAKEEAVKLKDRVSELVLNFMEKARGRGEALRVCDQYGHRGGDGKAGRCHRPAEDPSG